jgi:hypothetical protein
VDDGRLPSEVCVLHLPSHFHDSRFCSCQFPLNHLCLLNFLFGSVVLVACISLILAAMHSSIGVCCGDGASIVGSGYVSLTAVVVGASGHCVSAQLHIGDCCGAVCDGCLGHLGGVTAITVILMVNATAVLPIFSVSLAAVLWVLFRLVAVLTVFPLERLQQHYWG